MPKSVLDAIRMGFLGFEPDDVDELSFHATVAMPGTKEKIDVLADRASEGLPLWHGRDRTDYDEKPSQ